MSIEHSRSRLEDSPPTERVTVRVPTSKLERVEALVETGEFPNRSEAIRAAVDELVTEER